MYIQYYWQAYYKNLIKKKIQQTLTESGRDTGLHPFGKKKVNMKFQQFNLQHYLSLGLGLWFLFSIKSPKY